VTAVIPDIAGLRRHTATILCLGSHRGIIQSILDFDVLVGRTAPSVAGIIATGRHTERYFFGPSEIAIPVFADLSGLPDGLAKHASLILNLLSGRRAPVAMAEALKHLSALQGGVVFAERLPERSALELRAAAKDRGVWLLGGASIGIVIPGALKLGPIGGTEPSQLTGAALHAPGNVAVVSVSGGVANELIHALVSSGHQVSFAASAGGDRFAMATPAELLLGAQADPFTKHILYYGELGGNDEYEIAELLKAARITKPLTAHVAGRTAELFAQAPQFGHAGSLAETPAESAAAKSAALEEAGAQVAGTFAGFTSLIAALPHPSDAPPSATSGDLLAPRRPSLLSGTISRDRPDGGVDVGGHDLLELARTRSLAAIAAGLWLGRPQISPELEQAVDFILRLLVDHGPYQAAALNTITTARAGTNLVQALTAGLLAVGPRFGGATSQAAATWLTGVKGGQAPPELVEEHAAAHRYIAGIGHRKYSRHAPDPRVSAILEHSAKLDTHPFTDYALAVETVTTHKRPNLILNADGAMAAVLLDLLYVKESYSYEQLQRLVEHEFFNALFILSRSIGLMAHYFDQVRLDEGLLRLSPEDVAFIELTNLE
jgi:succinyl-CoA synthetase alpha subunit